VGIPGLVGIRRVAYTDGNSNQVARDNMAAALAPPFQAAAGLANLNDFREETGADLVIMVRPHDIELRGSCGIAYFPDGNPALGVNVVSDGMSSWSLCSDDVLIHEIGHNLGAGHQIGFGGGFFDARGSAFVRSGQFNTTMGSFGTGRPDRFRGLFMFSNPDADCGGTPCGTFNENNSAVLRQVAPAVASYRSAVSSVPMPDELDRSASDMDGDGVVDWSDPFPFDPAEQADGDGDGVGDNADLFPANAQESGDNDGDGVGDSVDPDDDDDGRSDFSDAFPFDPAEQDDSDFDGTGDVADARPGDRAEFRDTDGDGDGDNLDRDDDGDGFDELSVTDLDLLVISVGNSRILRFDAATGQARGIEVLPEDGLLTFQSDLAWRDSDNSLLYLSDSSIRRASLLDRTPLGTYVVAYDDSNSRPQLGTGFPTGLAAIPRDQARSVGEYYFAYGTSANVTFGEGAERALFGFDRFQLQGADLARDLTNDGGDVLALGRNRALYRGTGFASFQEPMTVLAGPGASWMSAPQRMAVHPDGRILISDTGRNAVLAADGDSGEFLGVVADVAAAGYSRPTGVAVNTDGETLVAVADQSAVLRFGIDGDFLGELVPAGSGGLSEPWAMITVPALVDRYPRDPERVIRPNAGLWFNPATNGRGFDIEVFGNVLTAIWYAYDEDGNPLWYYSQGTLTGFEYSGTLAIARLLEDGFEFEDIGTLSLSFFSERQAELSWTIDGEDGEETGGEPLQWLAFSNEPAPADYTGLWGRPDGPGWGISLATQGETTVALAFIYDDAGDPRWVISDPVTGDSPFAFDMFAAFSDTLCPTCSGAPDFERVSAGTMDITVPAVGAWSSEVTWPSPLPGQWLLDGTELVRFSEEPDRPR